MATRQVILDDVDLKYRNTFTTAQKLVWANAIELEIFETLELDSAPFNFTTVEESYLYPIPSTIDIDKVKVMSLQVNDADEPLFIEIPFKRNDDRQEVGYADYWYTVIENNWFLNIPGGPVDDRNVYVYHDTGPTEWTTSNLSSSPTTPKRFQELLKLGILMNVAMARKDSIMYNNYNADYEQKMSDIVWQRNLAEPEWTSPIDVLPRASRGRYNERVPIVITQTE